MIIHTQTFFELITSLVLKSVKNLKHATHTETAWTFCSNRYMYCLHNCLTKALSTHIRNGNGMGWGRAVFRPGHKTMLVGGQIYPLVFTFYMNSFTHTWRSRAFTLRSGRKTARLRFASMCVNRSFQHAWKAMKQPVVTSTEISLNPPNAIGTNYKNVVL